jgi:hypothetical protein
MKYKENGVGCQIIRHKVGKNIVEKTGLGIGVRGMPTALRVGFTATCGCAVPNRQLTFHCGRASEVEEILDAFFEGRPGEA